MSAGSGCTRRCWTRRCMRRSMATPDGGVGPAAGVLVPFSWQGVSLHAAGASAVRARIAPVGSVGGVDPSWPTGWGCRCCRWPRWWPRPVTQQQLMAAVSGSGPDRLFEVVWSPASPARRHRRDAVLRRVRAAVSAAEVGSGDVDWSTRRTHAALAARAVVADRARLRSVAGGDSGRDGVGGGRCHRFGGRRGVGVGAVGANRASRSDRAR